VGAVEASRAPSDDAGDRREVGNERRALDNARSSASSPGQWAAAHDYQENWLCGNQLCELLLVQVEVVAAFAQQLVVLAALDHAAGVQDEHFVRGADR
jgi:hypothetical protein